MMKVHNGNCFFPLGGKPFLFFLIVVVTLAEPLSGSSWDAQENVHFVVDFVLDLD